VCQFRNNSVIANLSIFGRTPWTGELLLIPDLLLLKSPTTVIKCYLFNNKYQPYLHFHTYMNGHRCMYAYICE
jgi:hypothetical protein